MVSRAGPLESESLGPPWSRGRVWLGPCLPLSRWCLADPQQLGRQSWETGLGSAFRWAGGGGGAWRGCPGFCGLEGGCRGHHSEEGAPAGQRRGLGDDHPQALPLALWTEAGELAAPLVLETDCTARWNPFLVSFLRALVWLGSVWFRFVSAPRVFFSSRRAEAEDLGVGGDRLGWHLWCNTAIKGNQPLCRSCEARCVPGWGGEWPESEGQGRASGSGSRGGQELEWAGLGWPDQGKYRGERSREEAQAPVTGPEAQPGLGTLARASSGRDERLKL